jgi:hypothetical protein
MQEINLHIDSMTMDLTKVTNDRAPLHMEYNKVRMEWDESLQEKKG